MAWKYGTHWESPRPKKLKSEEDLWALLPKYLDMVKEDSKTRFSVVALLQEMARGLEREGPRSQLKQEVERLSKLLMEQVRSTSDWEQWSEGQLIEWVENRVLQEAAEEVEEVLEKKVEGKVEEDLVEVEEDLVEAEKEGLEIEADEIAQEMVEDLEDLAELLEEELEERRDQFLDGAEPFGGWEKALNSMTKGVQINFALRTVNVSIAYFGPPGGGKTSSLEWLFFNAPANGCENLKAEEFDEGRLVQLDYLPAHLGKVAGMETRFNLRGFSGKALGELKQKLLCAYGIVFVVDSRRDKLEANRESWREMVDALKDLRMGPKSMPIVIQCNHQDSPQAMSLEEIAEELFVLSTPLVNSVAIIGEGVTEALNKIIKLTLDMLNSKHGGGGGRVRGSAKRRSPRRSSASMPPSPMAPPPPPRATPPAPMAAPSPPKPKIPRPGARKASRAPMFGKAMLGKSCPSMMHPEIKPMVEVELPPSRLGGNREKSSHWFENWISEDAGRPGPLERLVAQSRLLMRSLQATVGLKFILLANAVDSAVDSVAGYVRQVYENWKLLGAARRRWKRKDKGTLHREMIKDFNQGRLQLSRLFAWTGFSLKQGLEKMETAEEKSKSSRPTFALELALEVRGHLDQMQRDLDMVNVKQATQMVGKSLGEFLGSMIPNPAEWLSGAKDFFMFAFFVRYQRQEVEEKYVAFLADYVNLLGKIGDETKTPNMLKHEAHLARLHLDREEFLQERTLDEEIGRCRRSLQHLLQVLVNPGRLLNVRRWQRRELVRELAKVESLAEVPPVTLLELERWLTEVVAREMYQRKVPDSQEESWARYHEYRDFRRRYKLGKKLAAMFY